MSDDVRRLLDEERRKLQAEREQLQSRVPTFSGGKFPLRRDRAFS